MEKDEKYVSRQAVCAALELNPSAIAVLFAACDDNTVKPLRRRVGKAIRTVYRLPAIVAFLRRIAPLRFGDDQEASLLASSVVLGR